MLIFHHLLRCFISYLVQAVQVDSQLIVVTFFIEGLSSHASDSYFDWYHCLGAIGKPEGCLSCRGPRGSSISHKTLGTTLGHALSNRTLRIFNNVRFITSIYLFACGCPRDENWFLILSFEQKFLKSWLSNWHPLFDIIVISIPNLHTMFLHTKF